MSEHLGYKLIFDSSLQIGECEQHPSPDADRIGLMQRVLDATHTNPLRGIFDCCCSR